MNDFFESDVNKIFHSAGLERNDAPEMFSECLDILRSKMAALSVQLGLSYERPLVDDLKALKAKGNLR